MIEKEPDSSPLEDTPADGLVRKTILDRCRRRGPTQSICPSEVARRIARDDWRDRMGRVRRVAGELAREGQIVVTQRGNVVTIETAKGPVRLRMRDGRRGGTDG